MDITTLVITTTQGSTNSTIDGYDLWSAGYLQFYAYGNNTSTNDLTQAVTWTSSNTQVATISFGLSTGNGLATSVAAGTTTSPRPLQHLHQHRHHQPNHRADRSVVRGAIELVTHALAGATWVRRLLGSSLWQGAEKLAWRSDSRQGTT